MILPFVNSMLRRTIESRLEFESLMLERWCEMAGYYFNEVKVAEKLRMRLRKRAGYLDDGYTAALAWFFGLPLQEHLLERD